MLTALLLRTATTKRELFGFFDPYLFLDFRVPTSSLGAEKKQVLNVLFY